MRGQDSILSSNEVEQFFNRVNNKTNALGDMFNEIEQTLSQKLTPDQVNRMMALFRIFDGTPTAIKNGLVRTWIGILKL